MTLPRAALDFPDGLPIGQLQVEVHTNDLVKAERFWGFRNWWYMLEIAGLRPFHLPEMP